MSSSKDRFTDVELDNKRLPACYGYITWKLLPLKKAMEDLQHILPEINEFVTKAKQHCTHPDQYNLTKDEAAAIYLYTMEMSDDACVYRVLNQTLRAEDRSIVRPWFAYLKLLHSAASKLPKYKGIIYRGVNKNVSMKFQRGQKITWWSVSSCSKLVNVISSFLGNSQQSTLFNIECCSGKVIAAYTCYPAEDEVILMPGTVFEVVADPLHHHGGLHIVQLREIPDDDDDDDDDDDTDTKQGTSASAAISVTHQMSKVSLDHYPSSNIAGGSKGTPPLSKPPSKPQPVPMAAAAFYEPPPKPKQPPYKEFAELDKKLPCQGRPCAKCHKCRDWHFTGDRDTWDWMSNCKNWSNEDRKSYRANRGWENFTKRDGATCYIIDIYIYRIDYGDHLCLCEMH